MTIRIASATDATRDPQRALIVPLAVVAYVVVVAGVVGTDPGGQDGRWAGIVVLIALAALCWFLALDPSTPRPTVLTIALVTFGLCGAGLMLMQPNGPGFVLTYMAVAGLALALSARNAILLGVPLLLATAVAESVGTQRLLSHLTTMLLGGVFVIAIAAFAASNRAARAQIEALRQREAESLAQREQAAALAERARLARELHDILAHTLSGLSIRLEAARLLAERTHTDPRVVEQLAQSQQLARSGMAGARRAVSALRGDALPGVEALPGLVADARAAGLQASLSTDGTPWSPSAEAGLAVYRTVQEALTNVAKHAGATGVVTVGVSFREDCLEVVVQDEGGPGGTLTDAGGGYGLAGVTERVVLLGGTVACGPAGRGWRVQLRLPRDPQPASRRAPQTRVPAGPA